MKTTLPSKFCSGSLQIPRDIMVLEELSEVGAWAVRCAHCGLWVVGERAYPRKHAPPVLFTPPHPGGEGTAGSESRGLDRH